MTERPELTYDGFGINGPDEYRERLATFNKNTSEADLKRYGKLFAASPAMLRALQVIMAFSTDAKAAAVAKEAIEQATN